MEKKENKCILEKWLSPYADWGLVFLRLGVGIVFLVHGIQKLMGIAMVSGFFGQVGIPAAGFFAWVVAVVEAVGGLALILGFGARYAGLLLGVVMVVAIAKVHLANGFFAPNGYEYPFTLLAASLTFLFAGSGKKLSLEQKLCKKEC